jgi:hypothetical protein
LLRGRSSLFKRCSSRLTLLGCHLPRRAVGNPRLLSSRAMAFAVPTPSAWIARIVEASDLARASAACLCASTVLILPFVVRPRPLRILTTVVRCQLPPRVVGIPLRFSSCVSARWETKPAAISVRMVEAKARQRASVARLPANSACWPPLRDEVFPRACFMGPS